MIKKLIMLAFVALAIAMVVPSTRAQLLEAVKPVSDKIQGSLVPRRLDVMAGQVDYRLGRREGFPEDWEEWLVDEFTGVPEDPWGNSYYLRPGRREYTIGSMGGDGEQGTEDDITLTRPVPGG